MKSFRTNNVIIRKFEMEDLEDIHYNILTQEEIIDMANEKIYSDLNESRIVLKSAMNEYYTDEPVWAVEDKKEKRLVGFIRINNYSEKNRKCNLTWAVAYKYWNSYFMEDALVKVIRFLFTKKNIDLIECSFYEKHKISSTILENIGMIKEATLRERRIDEKTHKKEDFVVYSINKNEFFEKIDNKLEICEVGSM